MRRYNIPGGTIATTSSSYKSAVSIGTTGSAPTVVPVVYDYSVGTSGTPADNSMQWEVIRMSGTVGTSTAATPSPLQVGDGAAGANAGINYTAEQGTPGVVIDGPFDLNMRATYRWVAAPGSELYAIQTAAASINIRALSSAYTGVSDAKLMYWE